MSRTGSAFVLAAIVILVGLLLAVTDIMLGRARAHDAIPTAAQPQGWTYPLDCCSNYDCQPLVEGDIVRDDARGGWLITFTGEFLADGDPRIRQSPDGRPHGCWIAGKPGPRALCAFVAPGGS